MYQSARGKTDSLRLLSSDHLHAIANNFHNQRQEREMKSFKGLILKEEEVNDEASFAVYTLPNGCDKGGTTFSVCVGINPHLDNTCICRCEEESCLFLCSNDLIAWSKAVQTLICEPQVALRGSNCSSRSRSATSKIK